MASPWWEGVGGGQVVTQRMMAAAMVGPGTVMVDLGSGDGALLLAAAALGAHAVGSVPPRE